MDERPSLSCRETMQATAQAGDVTCNFRTTGRGNETNSSNATEGTKRIKGRDVKKNLGEVGPAQVRDKANAAKATGAGLLDRSGLQAGLEPVR